MKSITLKIAESLDRRLAEEADRLGVSKSEIVRDALDAYLENGGKAKRLSCLDLVRDLAGAFEGPPDLSTNPKYLEGYGR